MPVEFSYNLPISHTKKYLSWMKKQDRKQKEYEDRMRKVKAVLKKQESEKGVK